MVKAIHYQTAGEFDTLNQVYRQPSLPSKIFIQNSAVYDRNCVDITPLQLTILESHFVQTYFKRRQNKT